MVEEDHSAPLFAIQAWIRAGSVNEEEDQAGLAHLLEHMLFRRIMPPGSEPGKLAEQVESAGGDINAYTSPDCTVVHLVLPSASSEKGFQAIASVFSGPDFNPSDLEEEKKVVIEEINRSEDLPEGLLMKRLFSESFWVHPYGRPVIGNRESVERFTVQDLESFFRKYYRPERIAISAAGDASLEKVIKGLEKEFKAQSSKVKVESSKFKNPTPKTPRPKPDCRLQADYSRPPEPPQRGFRREVERGRWAKAHLALAFHVGGIRDERVAAVDLLASILGEGPDSKLRRELEERQRLVYSISASAYTPADPGLLIVQAELDPGNLAKVTRAILAGIGSLRRGEIRPEELKRAQAQLASEYFRDGESREGRAGQLGFIYTFTPGISYEIQYLRQIQRATVGEIQQAAEKYLQVDNLNMIALLPEKSLLGFSEADLDAGLVGYLRDEAGGRGEAGKPVTAPMVERNEFGAKVQFPNGLRLIIREKPGSGTVAIVSVFLGGLRAEKPGREGISNLCAELLTRGNERLGPLGIAETVKLMGGELEGFSGFQSLGLKSLFLASSWLPGLELTAEMIQDPTFLETEISKLKEKISAGIKSRDENLLQLAFLRLREARYGGKPYGHDVLGTLASVSRLTRDDLRDFYQSVVRPENLVIAVVGDIEEKEVISQAGRLWGGWEPEKAQSSKVKGQIKPDQPEKPEKPDKPKEIYFPVPGSKQVHLVWGFPGTTFLSPDRFPLELIDAVLSGQSGRLFRNIRDREGLAYMVGSSNMIGLEPGFFALYLATSPENKDQAIKAVSGELANLVSGGISREEVKRAKAYIIGTFEASRQTSSQMALGMALDEIYGLGFDFAAAYINNIKEVDISDLPGIMGKYLDMGKGIMVGVGATGN